MEQRLRSSFYKKGFEEVNDKCSEKVLKRLIEEAYIKRKLNGKMELATSR